MIEIRNEADTRKSYNDLFSREGILLRDSFYLWLVKLLRPQADRILLDISCGQGRLVSLARGLNLRALGIDFAFTAIQKSHQDCAIAGWAVGDGELLPIADVSVDYVTHIGSLEHYHHMEKGVREIARVLKKDGKACLLLPNAFGLLGNISHVCKHGAVFNDGQPLQRYGTCQAWVGLLENNGLELEKIIGYNEVEAPRNWKDIAWYLIHPQKILRAIISALIPLNLANHFVFICHRNAAHST